MLFRICGSKTGHSSIPKYSHAIAALGAAISFAFAVPSNAAIKLTDGATMTPVARANLISGERRYKVQISSQPLPSALEELHRQTGLQFFFAPDKIADIQAVGVSGHLTAEEALQKILRDTGISYLFTGSGKAGLRLAQSNEVIVLASASRASSSLSAFIGTA